MLRRGLRSVHFLATVATLLLGHGCLDPDGHVPDDYAPSVSGLLSETIPTVFVVSWDDIEGDVVTAAVEYGRDGQDLEFTAPAHLTDDGAPEVWLLGLKPDTDYSWQASLEATSGSWTSRVGAFTTGPLAGELPPLDIETFDASRTTDGFLITALWDRDRYAAAIIDLDGDYVWWYLLEAGKTSSGASLSADGLWVEFLVIETPDTVVVPDHLRRIALDGSREERIALPWGVHHDLTRLDDGTRTYLAYDEREIGDGSVLGDRIVQLDADGELLTLWTQWDHDTYSDPDPADLQTEWGHGNALVYGAQSDAWYLSMHNFGSIYQIDRDSGQVNWRLGGEHSDFVFTGENDKGFQDQHGFEVLDATLLVFDNGSPQRYSSRAVEYELDLVGGEAVETWQYEANPALYCPALGDVARLPDGSTLVGFSSEGRIEHVSAQGELLWVSQLPMGSIYWYFDWVEDLYPDGASPALL